MNRPATRPRPSLERPRARPAIRRARPTYADVALVALAALVGLATPPARGGDLAVEAHGGYFEMTAGNSATALFGSPGGATVGGAVRYTFWRGAFASAGARTFSKEGERVFLARTGSPVQRLGFPLSIRLTPILLQAGWRFRDGRKVVPYVSAGAALTLLSERSEVAGESFGDDRTKAGFVGAAGVEIGRGRFRFGAEAGFSSVPDAVGVGGVSKVYGEDDLGGFHAIGKVVYGF